METNTTQENQKHQRKRDLSESEEIRGLIDEMETMVNTATQIPLSGRCMVRSGDMLDCISKIRPLLIKAFAQAEGIVEQEKEILSAARNKANEMADQADAQVKNANAESERILKEAQENADAMAKKAEAEYKAKVEFVLSREEIVRDAHLKAQEIIANAQEEEKRCHAHGGEILDSANRDAEKILEDARAEEAAIIGHAQQWADDLRKQVREEAFAAFSSAIAAINLKSQAFDKGASALIANATELSNVLNDSGDMLGNFAVDMAKRRDELFPDQNL